MFRWTLSRLLARFVDALLNGLHSHALASVAASTHKASLGVFTCMPPTPKKKTDPVAWVARAVV